MRLPPARPSFSRSAIAAAAGAGCGRAKGGGERKMRCRRRSLGPRLAPRARGKAKRSNAVQLRRKAATSCSEYHRSSSKIETCGGCNCTSRAFPPRSETPSMNGPRSKGDGEACRSRRHRGGGRDVAGKRRRKKKDEGDDGRAGHRPSLCRRAKAAKAVAAFNPVVLAPRRSGPRRRPHAAKVRGWPLQDEKEEERPAASALPGPASPR